MTNTQFPQSKWVHILMCNTHREGEKKGEKKEQRAALMPQLNRILFFFSLFSLFCDSKCNVIDFLDLRSSVQAKSKRMHTHIYLFTLFFSS